MDTRNKKTSNDYELPKNENLCIISTTTWSFTEIFEK